MRRLCGILGFGRIETIVRGKPGGKRDRRWVRRPQLAQRNAIVADCDCGGLAAGHNRIDHALFERKPLRIAVARQQKLEGQMALGLERLTLAERIPNRMR